MQTLVLLALMVWSAPLAFANGDDSCQEAFDNVCDELRYAGSGACPDGTDTTDCSAVEALMSSVSPGADDSCEYAFDQECDDPEMGGTAFCLPGTDRTDCAFLAAGDLCYWANDGECDERRFDGTGRCTDGSDTTDCQLSNSCQSAFDGQCDEPRIGLDVCASGTDTLDCAAVAHLRDRDNSCPTAFNNVCDEDSGGCARLTDTVDCLGREVAPGVADYFSGWDDRELVDARSFPWRAIGQVHFPESACTATLIGPDLLITAAHCFFDSDDRRIAPEYFLLGQNGDDYTARGTIRRYYVSPDYDDSAVVPLGEGNGNDWGFIQIDETLGDQYGHMTVLALDDEIRGTLLSADDLAIRQAGYSWDTGNHLSGHVGCRIVEFLSDDTFLHECDTTVGDSGSPLFVLRGDTADIVGIDTQSLLDIDIQSLLDTDIQSLLDKENKLVNLAVAASAVEQPLQDFINGAGIVVGEPGVQPTGNDSCASANNLECDEWQFGGTGDCFAGTDYSDCRALSVGGDDSCLWAFDEVCDEPRIGLDLCTSGTDTSDCAAVAHLRNRDNSCPTAFDGVCDENGGHCAPLTDTVDCLGRDTAPDAINHYSGIDDRELVDIRNFPWSAIGQVHFRDRACTATLIGPDLLITAARCFFDSYANSVAPEVFLLGQNEDNYTARGTIRRYYVSPDYSPWSEDAVREERIRLLHQFEQPHASPDDDPLVKLPWGTGIGNDWAFIQINEALGDQYGHMTILTLDEARRAQFTVATDLTIRQAGYSRDTGNHLSGHVGCHIREFLPNDTFRHECDTADSGSPLFVLLGDTGESNDLTAAIVGIDSQFGDFAVAASAVEQPLQDFINGAGTVAGVQPSDDSCSLANNLECDELQLGGTGNCAAGTDESDCRALSVGGDDSCHGAFDKECGEPGIGGGGTVPPVRTLPTAPRLPICATVTIAARPRSTTSATRIAAAVPR